MSGSWEIISLHAGFSVESLASGYARNLHPLTSISQTAVRICDYLAITCHRNDYKRAMFRIGRDKSTVASDSERCISHPNAIDRILNRYAKWGRVIQRIRRGWHSPRLQWRAMSKESDGQWGMRIEPTCPNGETARNADFSNLSFYFSRKDRMCSESKPPMPQTRPVTNQASCP